MDTSNLLHPEVINQLISYNPETGFMSWKERDPKSFKRYRDFLTWTQRFEGKEAFGSKNKNGYRSSPVWGSKKYTGHSVAWAIFYGEWPSDQIDHINGDRSDNRIKNLRSVSNADNTKNRATPKCNTSGAQGVQKRKESGRYRAFINADKKRIWLGTYDTFDEALAVRKSAERDLGYHENHGRVV